MAQPAGADGEDFIYRVVSRDTLLDLSKRYTGNASNWSQLRTLNGVDDPARLPVGRELRIPFSLIPVIAAQASVIHMTGQATVNERPLNTGIPIVEGDIVRTSGSSFITIELADESRLMVPSDSVLHVKRLRMFQGTRLTDAILEVQSGALESDVAPLKSGVGRFEVITPVAVTGVRGTRLRVRANSNGTQSEVVSGQARVKANRQGNVIVRAGQGAATDTSGALLGVRPLLPAPRLQTPYRDGGGWLLGFTPVPGAHAYLVRVTKDAEGTQQYSSARIDAPLASFRAPGPGHFYVVIRAIDRDGLMGEDAAVPFVGERGLLSRSGEPVLTGFGAQVTLSEF